MLWRRISLAAALAALVLGFALPCLAQGESSPASGATLGPGDEGVGALVSPAPAAPGPLAASTTADAAAPETPAAPKAQAEAASAPASAKAGHHAKPPRRPAGALRKLKR